MDTLSRAIGTSVLCASCAQTLCDRARTRDPALALAHQLFIAGGGREREKERIEYPVMETLSPRDWYICTIRILCPGAMR
jgi:hypothetical protein